MLSIILTICLLILLIILILAAIEFSKLMFMDIVDAFLALKILLTSFKRMCKKYKIKEGSKIYSNSKIDPYYFIVDKLREDSADMSAYRKCDNTFVMFVHSDLKKIFLIENNWMVSNKNLSKHESLE